MGLDGIRSNALTGDQKCTSLPIETFTKTTEHKELG